MPDLRHQLVPGDLVERLLQRAEGAERQIADLHDLLADAYGCIDVEVWPTVAARIEQILVDCRHPACATPTKE